MRPLAREEAASARRLLTSSDLNVAFPRKTTSANPRKGHQDIGGSDRRTLNLLLWISACRWELVSLCGAVLKRNPIGKPPLWGSLKKYKPIRGLKRKAAKTLNPETLNPKPPFDWVNQQKITKQIDEIGQTHRAHGRDELRPAKTERAAQMLHTRTLPVKMGHRPIMYNIYIYTYVLCVSPSEGTLKMYVKIGNRPVVYIPIYIYIGLYICL